MSKAFLATVCSAAMSLLAVQSGFADTVTITPATGGTNLSADTAANAASPTWTTLGPIVIDEVSNPNRASFLTGTNVTLVLKAPVGFEFNTSVTPAITFTAGRDITNATIAVSDPSTLTITLTVKDISNVDKLSVTNGIQVRPISGGSLTNGQIFRPTSGGGSATILGIGTSANANGSGGTNFGSLTEVVGVATKLAFTTQPGAGVAGVPLSVQPVVKSRDQFSNNSTSGLPSSLTVTVALTSGTGPLLGTTALNIGMSGGNGTVTYTNLQIDAGGTNKQLTASAAGLTNAVSAFFSVNGPPTVSAIADQTTNEDTSMSNIPFTISDGETPASNLVVTAASSNTNLVPNANLVLGGSGSNRNLTITPATNQFGSATITITVSDGTMTTNTSFLASFNPVNDAPTFSTIAGQVINEDTSSGVIPFTVIDPETPAAGLTVLASSSNTNLLSVTNIVLAGSGTNRSLTLTPLTNQFGAATITISTDDGTNLGTSSFLLTVNPVNDAPTLDPLTNLTLGVNTGARTVNFGGIGSGASNEVQFLSVTAVSGNTNVIPHPGVSYTNPSAAGTLTFTPRTNASGAATITVTVQDDGGTTNGGTNVFSRQFTVTVIPQSDLAIRHQTAPTPVFFGANITNFITITNQGPSTASNVVVVYNLPPGSEFVSAGVSQGTSSANSTTVTCNLGSVTNAGIAVATIAVSPTTLGTVTNVANVSADVADPNSTNNSSTVLVPVVPANFQVTAVSLAAETCVDGAIDPAETVTVNFSIRNLGSFDTTNLVATLRASGGVLSPGAPQTYGVLAAGGAAVSRAFSFVPVGVCGGTFTATLQLQDGAANLGIVTNTFTFGNKVTNLWPFAKISTLSIPSVGTASPFPSTNVVSGVPGPIVKVTVTLTNLTHGNPPDLDILLVGPGGQRVMLMSDAGSVLSGIANVALTLDDTAASALPSPSQIVSGTFRPTDYQSGDSLPSPAPVAPYGTNLSAFAGTDPNGAWRLYVADDNSGFSGSIGGWILNIYSRDPSCCVDGGAVNLGLTASPAPDPVVVGHDLIYTIAVTNGGPATATGVILTNLLPANTTFVSATASQGSCTNLGTVCVCNLGTLPNGSSATVTLTVKPTLAGTLTNSAVVTASQPDYNLANNTVTVTSVVAAPTVSVVAGPGVAEGDTGTTNALFSIQLSTFSSQTISVDFSTADGIAVAGGDYVSTNGTLVFAPGQTNKSITVAVKGDALNESTESFLVNLSNPTNVTLAIGQATSLILDDDPLPSLSINDLSIAEGNGGTTNANFTVTLSPASGQTVLISYGTTNGTAIAPADYFSTSGLLTFAPGDTAKTIMVAVRGDITNELSETFTVGLAGQVNANLGKDQGTNTIVNDDLFPTIVSTGATLTVENCIPTNGVVDPNETVTVSISLRNVSAGGANASNLVATLLPLGGVLSPSSPQNYGSLVAGGATVSRPFTFTANGNCGDKLPVVLQLQDGTTNIGTVTNIMTLGKFGTTNFTFANTAAVTIPNSGPAAPYPATINVAGLSNPVTKVTVALTNLNHTYPDDLDILLVGPLGQTVMLMSDAGLGSPLTSVTLRFDDAASGSLPDATAIVAGTYKPTNFETPDAFSSPAPSEPFSTNLSVFSDLDPNGAWSLYIFDDTAGDAGDLAGGWSLTITTLSDPICCGGSSLADLAVTKIDAPDPIMIGSNVTYTITVTNRGPNPAVSALLTDTLPPTTSLVSASTTLGSLTNVGGQLTCNFGLLTTAVQATVTVTVTATNAGRLTNIAIVSAQTADPNTANNTAAAVTAVLPIVSLVATDDTAAEAGADAGTLTAKRVGGTAGDLAVTYTISGTAGNGTDYTLLSGSVTISNGAASASIAITPVNDFLVEPTETVVLTLSSNANYLINSFSNSGTVGILDDDVQSLLVAAVQTVSITSLQTNNTNVLISFVTTNGQLYRVERTDDTGGLWTAVADNVAGTGGVVQVTDPGGATQPNRFYRVLLLTPIFPVPISIGEGGSNTFTVRLAAQPTNSVTVTITRTGGDVDVAVASATNLLFSQLNWDTPQTVTVRAVEDDDAANGQATFTISSAGLPDQTVLATEIDNDSQYLIVSDNTISVLEGSTNTFTIRLGAQPTNNLAITAARTGGDTNLIVAGGGILTFTPANWQLPQAVTIAALENNSDLANGQATFAVSGLSVSNQTVSVTEIDNDVLNPVVSTDTLSVPEGGSNSFTVRLSMQPASNVVASIIRTNGDPDLGVAGGVATLTFTTNNWNVPQIVAIAAAEDPDVLNGQALYVVSLPNLNAQTITVTEIENDSLYLIASVLQVLRVAPPQLTGSNVVVTFNSILSNSYRLQRVDALGDSNWVTVADNVPGTGGPLPITDTGGAVPTSRFYRVIQLTQVDPGVLVVPESGTNSFTVRLSAQPTNNIVVSVLRTNGDTDLSVSSGAALTFTTNTWNVAQTVRVAAAEDADAVNGQALLAFVPNGGLTNQTLPVRELDNDTQYLIVSTNALAVPEGGTNFFTVRLNAQPTNDVSVTTAFTSGDGSLSVTNGGTLTFTTNNWNTAQPVVLSAAEDLDAVNGSATFTVSSAGLTNQLVTASEVENDVQFIVVSTITLSVPEAGTNFFTVRLNAQPTNDVTVNTARTAGDASLSVTSGAVLTFTTNNWNAAQPVVLSAAEDLDAVNGSATFTVSSAGLTNQTVTASEVENDVQFIVVSTNALSVPEAGTNFFTVRLNAQPTNDVTVNTARTAGDTSLSVTNGGTLTFTTNNWNTAQPVVLSATDDLDAVNGSATFTVSSAGLTNQLVTASEVENDVQFIVVSTNALSVPEGGTNFFTVRLNAQPTNDVTVNTARTAGDTSLSVTNGGTLTFTTNNWNTAQPVVLSAAEDLDAVNGSATFTVSSAGLTNQLVTASEVENDVQFIVVSTNALLVPEGGTNFFTVRLNAQPTNDVSVTTVFASGDSDLSVSNGATLTFTTNNWNTTQPVVLRAVEDDDTVTGQATFTVSSAGLTNISVTATETDNDVLTLLVSTNALYVPEGTTNTVNVWLSARPTNGITVTVTLTNTDPDLTLLSGAALIFTTNNWNVTQPVAVAAVEDADAVAGQGLLVFSAPEFTNQTVTATEVENDVQFIVVSTNALSVPEAGTNFFTVRLNAQPTNDVTVNTARTAGDASLSVTNGGTLTFTTNNWNTAQPVVLSAAEDLDAVNGSATFTVSSTGLTNQLVTASEVENDVQFIVISTNALSVPEGSTNFFTVRLNAQPTNNVTVNTARTAGDTSLSVTGGGTLTFTTNNWNTAQPVVLSAAEDLDAVNGSATFTVSSAGLTNQLVTATEVENDVQFIVVSTNALLVPEGGTNFFTVRLNAQPTNDVSVTTVFTSGDPDLSVSNGATLTFTTNNWNTTQPVVLRAVEDADTLAGQATFTVSSAGLTNQTVTATEVENDVQFIVVSTITLSVPEAGTNFFTVRLNAQPTNDVSVTTVFTSGDPDLSVSNGATLTFTTNDWSVPQPVVLAAVEDLDAVNGSATFTVSSAGLTNQTVTASEVENDVQFIVVSTNALSVPEAGTNFFTVRLNAQPTNDVTVNTARTAGDASLSVTNGGTLTFTTNNWNTAQPVVLSAAEDLDAVNGSATFTVSSTGLTNQLVTASEVENDVQFIVISTNALSVPEGSTNFFTVRLNAQPTNNVTVNTARTAGDTSLSVTGGGTLTFTTNNWNTAQPVVLSAAEDLDAVNGSATFTVSSAGLTNQLVTATEVENDVQFIVVSTNALLVPEGGTNFFTVRLNAQPTNDVSVTTVFTSGDPDLSVSNGATLTFTTNNWNTTQPVVLRAVEDADTLAGQATFTVSSAGLTNQTVTATEVENDVQFIVVSTITLSVPEAGTNFFTVRLNAQPTNDVSVTTVFTSGDPDLSVSNGATLTFTTNDWSVPQPVVLAAVEDLDAVNGSATFTVSSAGLTNRLVTATEVENDVQFIVVSTNALLVPEGETNFFTVRLNAQPTNDVTVNTARTAGDASLSVTNGGTLTFTTNNWNTAQPVVLSAAEDLDAVNGSATFTVSSAGLTNQLVTASEVENDVQFIVVSTNALLVPEGETNFFTVRLNAQPTNDVTVNTARTAGDASLSVTNGGTLTFTTNNWNTAQPVVLSAAEDLDAVNGSATFTVSSAGLTNQLVTATETDNEILTLVVSTNALLLPEGGTNFFTVRLNAQPTNDVSVTTVFTSGDPDLSVSNGATLTFTTNDWNIAQPVVLSAAEDLDAVNGSATFTVSSAGLTNRLVTATEVENDVQFIVVSTNSLLVPEGGTNFFTVRLNAQPTNDVSVTTVFRSGDPDLSVSNGATLTFTTNDWSVPQPVVLAAAEDDDAVDGTATFTVSSAGLTNQLVTASEVENDVQFIVVSTNSLLVPEGGTNFFTVRLNAQPTNDVSVTTVFTSGDPDLSVSNGATLTFTTNNWNTTQPVVLRAVEDADTLAGQATFTISSAGLTNQLVTASEVENDVQFIVVSTNSLLVPEGGTNFFTVRLNAQPTNDVSVTTVFTSGDPDLSVSNGATLTFTTNDWSVPQPVVLAAVEDDDAVDGTATFTVSSGGLTNQTVMATEVENDVQFIVVSTNALLVPEGGTNFFTVRLNAQPTNDVSVTTVFTSGDPDLSVSNGATLTFTTNDWSVPQPVVLAAVEDLDAVDGTATFTVSSAGLTNQLVTASEVENDVQFIVVSTNSLLVPEGGTNFFTVRLNAQPTNDVSVTTVFTSGDPDLSVSNGATLTFTTNDWSVPQPVVLAAVEDLDAVEGAATFTISSAGLTNQLVTASEVENDVQFLIVSTNSVVVPESGTNFFTVRLNAQPTGEVTVTAQFTSGDTDLSVTNGETLTFYPTNWNLEQIVTLYAAPDPDLTDGEAEFTVASTNLTNVVITAVESDTGAGILAALVLDAPRISTLYLDGADIHVEFTAQTGRGYVLEYTDDLTAGQWTVAGSAAIGKGGKAQLTDAAGAGRSQRFYRIRELP